MAANRQVRMDARPDPETQAKLEELVHTFRRARAVILRQIMHWGVNRDHSGPIPDADRGPFSSFFVLVDGTLHEQVQRAAMEAGMHMASWLRHMVRQMAPGDFPPSWHGGPAEVPTINPYGRAARHSHDSRHYDTRFMLRLNGSAGAKLQQLVEALQTSKAEIIRHLILQATPADFPEQWRLAVAERRSQDDEMARKVP